MGPELVLSLFVVVILAMLILGVATSASREQAAKEQRIAAAEQKERERAKKQAEAAKRKHIAEQRREAAAEKRMAKEEAAREKATNKKLVGNAKEEAYTQAVQIHTQSVMHALNRESKLLLAASDVPIILDMKAKLEASGTHAAPFATDVFSRIADLYESQGKYEKAIEYCQKSMSYGMDIEIMKEKIEQLKEAQQGNG